MGVKDIKCSTCEHKTNAQTTASDFTRVCGHKKAKRKKVTCRIKAPMKTHPRWCPRAITGI